MIRINFCSHYDFTRVFFQLLSNVFYKKYLIMADQLSLNENLFTFPTKKFPKDRNMLYSFLTSLELKTENRKVVYGTKLNMNVALK